MPKVTTTYITSLKMAVYHCYKSLTRDKCELCNLITWAFLAADTKVMAVGQPVGSVSVSYHAATFTVCTRMTCRLPSDPRPLHWCGAVRMALMLRPGVDWAPLKPVTHVAFVWQPSRCKNWGHIPPVSAMCSLSSEHSGWCHSTTTPYLPPPGISMGTPGLAGLH